MAQRRRKANRLQGDFTLGGEQAEADPLLQLAFYETGDYSALSSELEPRCFVIARTGGGKSAALQRLEETHSDKVIRIAPEDLSLPYVTDLQVFRQLEQMGVHLDLFFVALWKHVLIVELIRHRYKVDTPAAKQRFLSDLRRLIKRDPAKMQALAYLDEFEGRFWCETDERVREITTRFEKSLNAAGGVGVAPFGQSVDASLARASSESREVRSEEVDRYQRIVNEFQLARLNKMIAVLDENVLDSSQLQTFIVIDDLDRQWVEERVANNLIRCLFRAILDLKRIRYLKVLVALRTNLFVQLDFGALAGGQAEKLRALTLNLRWTKGDLRALLDARVAVASELFGVNKLSTIDSLLPARNRTRGDPLDYILARTLMRPRDVLAYVNLCIELARGQPRVTWKNIIGAEQSYSEGRLLALQDEWSVNLPGLDSVLRCFAKSLSPMQRDEFTQRLHDIMLLPALRGFGGVTWVSRLSSNYWENQSGAEDWVENYLPLAACLYDIGFIGCAGQQGNAPTYSYEDPSFLNRPTNLGETCCFYVHPAFHAALDIRIERGKAWLDE